MSVDSDLKKLKTDVRDLRKFGLTVGSALILLGILLFFRHRSGSPYFLGTGFGLMTLGVTWPRMLKYVYIGWMALAFTIGMVISNVILALFFFLFVTPIGLLARLFGKDFLGRRWDKKAASYWIDCAGEITTTESYERQF